MSSFVNISTYKFVALSNLQQLRERLIGHCKERGLKGTILLSTEGINLFVAGTLPAIDFLLGELRTVPGLFDLAPKVSESAEQPFSRMLVRIKREIIAFGVEAINPAQRTSPKLTARQLKAWLDEGRPVTLLDARNDYEVRLGTFKNALPIGVNHFREFPNAAQRLPEELKDQPIVMFCTGGIRCEKAGPFLEREGFRNVFQLEGGILKYFEECGDAHYEGECFVFDQRVGVDPSLRETGATQCYQCQTPLNAEDQRDSRWVPSVSCPYCFKSNETQMAENIHRRQELICRATNPLPGSQAYDNYRPINVPAELDGVTLVDLVSRIFPHVPSATWDMRIREGLLRNDNKQPVFANQRVRNGERYLHLLPATVEPDVRADIRVLHEDEAILVLDKPAPLPIHPCGRFNRNSLQSILNTVYRPQKPRVAHRLDANTTGLVVCARTRHYAGLLQPQFMASEVEKVYLVRVQGHPSENNFFCEAPISDEPEALGTRRVDQEHGLAARTNFKVVERFPDGTALLEARPITGRTNQIRIHLWHLLFPVRGDQAYLPGRQIGVTQTLAVNDPPLCLHAWRLGFVHPLTLTRVKFAAPLPAWADYPSLHSNLEAKNTPPVLNGK